MTKRKTMEKWFDLVWKKEESAAIFDMFKPEIESGKTADGLQKESALGPQGFADFHKSLLKLIKDVQVTIDSYMEEGDWVMAECTLTAKNRKSGNEEAVGCKGAIRARVVDGKILEANNHFDFLHLFEGLGLLPKNTMYNCLSGNKVLFSFEEQVV